jgi:hypothetical protein
MNTLAALPVRQDKPNKWMTVGGLCVAEIALAAAAILLLRSVPANALPTFTTLPSPDKNVSGISYDGSSLWITIDGGRMIYQVDEKTNAIRRKIPFFEQASAGSAWDGRNLWQIAWISKKIYRIDLGTGAVVYRFPTPGAGMCSGMTYDGKYLWVANFEDGKIYQIDQNQNGRILRTIDGLSEVTGLAWDGEYLWNGILVGTKSHDEVTPYTGFFQQRDLHSMATLRVVPIPGIGPGTSDWLPGGKLSRRFWWYDMFYERMVRVDLPGRQFSWQYLAGLAMICAAGVSLALQIGRVGSRRDQLPGRERLSVAGR